MFLQLPLLLSMADIERGNVEDPVTIDATTKIDAPSPETKRKHAGFATEAFRNINKKIDENRQSRLSKELKGHGNPRSINSPNADGAPNQLRITTYTEDADQTARQTFILGMASPGWRTKNKNGKLVKETNLTSNGETFNKNNWLENSLKFAVPMIPKRNYEGSMYFPAPELQTTYNFAWEQDTNKAVAKLAEIGSFADAAKNISDGQIGGGIAGLVASMSKDNPDLITQTLYSNNRIAFNEPIQQYFKGLDVRTFTFSWKFIPKDKTEWEAVKSIITRLNKYSHPEVIAGNNSKFYRYPAEYGLEYLVLKPNGKLDLNTNLPRIGRCVCTNVDVNYSPNRLVTHDEGEPVEIDLSLSFTEIEKLERTQFLTEDHKDQTF